MSDQSSLDSVLKRIATGLRLPQDYLEDNYTRLARVTLHVSEAGERPTV